jgi:hypothetical protein
LDVGDSQEGVQGARTPRPPVTPLPPVVTAPSHTRLHGHPMRLMLPKSLMQESQKIPEMLPTEEITKLRTVRKLTHIGDSAAVREWVRKVGQHVKKALGPVGKRYRTFTKGARSIALIEAGKVLAHRPVHRDVNLSYNKEGKIEEDNLEAPNYLTVLVALDKITKENGTVWFWPGSEQFPEPASLRATDGWEATEVEAGAVVAFNSRLCHQSKSSVVLEVRRNVQFYMIAVGNTLSVIF